MLYRCLSDHNMLITDLTLSLFMYARSLTVKGLMRSFFMLYTYSYAIIHFVKNFKLLH